jgi:hypothetical protein
LHKRAALSLNCIAEMLTHPSDEIIFVDYNSPDDLATFPEVIQDALTSRVRGLLRILRVRPRQHKPFASSTQLSVLEPIARNVGLRRSLPMNRWILSTNTDTLLVSRFGNPMSTVAARLISGCYHLPRFEMPVSLWESLDRRRAEVSIREMEYWGRRFHLNEIVCSQDPAIRFDSPGDFQLIMRHDLVRIHGFDENMLHGWHIDANIAKRMKLLYGRASGYLEQFLCYHCEHTRNLTQLHRAAGNRNSWSTFVDGVTTAFVPRQAGDWGLAREDVEEIRLAPPS